VPAEFTPKKMGSLSTTEEFSVGRVLVLNSPPPCLGRGAGTLREVREHDPDFVLGLRVAAVGAGDEPGFGAPGHGGNRRTLGRRRGDRLRSFL